MDNTKKRARALSEQFLREESQYRLGFIEAEQPNPKTKHLGEDFMEDTLSGIRLLASVDRDLLSLYEKTLNSKKFDELVVAVTASLMAGGRIIISGCGSTGRLAMRIEASWRQAIRGLTVTQPEAKKLENSVLELMTGGDYAIIRSVEAFEDYTCLGEMQARELSLGESDLLIGVTATGETTSILGTAKQALSDGAKVFMVICTDPSTILGKLARADDVYTHRKCNSLYMNCGGMALTGSTRMQSSTIEQLVISSALELALYRLFPTENIYVDKKTLIEGFTRSIALLSVNETEALICKQIETEAELYKNGGHVTYFANEYLLDVLADTTERAPTFSVPHFRPQTSVELPLSWAFVKNPVKSTKDAWEACFERTPRCIDKTPEEYASIGIDPRDVEKISKINLDAIYEFEIGNEPDPEREAGESLATWIGFNYDLTSEFFTHASKYKNATVLIFHSGGAPMISTQLKIFEHISAKMIINIISTGTMAKIGRIRGNYMVYISISNKKLIDRATRIVSALCDVDYERANYELFLSKVMLDSKNISGMTAIATIERLLMQKSTEESNGN